MISHKTKLNSAMPGLFSLTESLLGRWTLSMKLMWRCSGAAVVFGSVLGAVSEEVALFAKAAKFVVL